MSPTQPTSEYNFAAHFPGLLVEWDYDKNEKPPEEYTPRSGKRVWWNCRHCGHNHISAISNKIRPSNDKCKSCIGREVHSDGHNSLARIRPELVKDWNDPRSPEEFRTGSTYSAKWKCHVCDHEWETKIRKRAELGRGCLSCAGQQAHSSGRDSVRTMNPELMEEWHDEKDPSKYLPGSHVKVDWKCKYCSHVWLAGIRDRAIRKYGCNFCNGPRGKYARVVHSDGHNSMRNTNTRLTREFHPDLNEDMTPDNIIEGTNKKIWWICSLDCKTNKGEICENIWRNTGNHRAAGQNCPTCMSGDLHSDGRNSFARLRPDLLEEWDFEENIETRQPEEVTVRSGERVSWKCKHCGNKWKARVAERSGGSGCGGCSNTGFNPLAPAYYYVNVIVNESGDYLEYKGGITNNDPQMRFRDQRASLRGFYPSLSYERVEDHFFKIGEEARDLETKLKGITEIRAGKRDFDGGSELFIQNPLEFARENSML